MCGILDQAKVGTTSLQVRYRKAETSNQYDRFRLLKKQLTEMNIKDLGSKRLFLSQGMNDRVLIDWALNLRHLFARQDGLNVSKECGHQLGQFSDNLNSILSNFTSPSDLFEEKNWSLKGN